MSAMNRQLALATLAAAAFGAAHAAVGDSTTYRFNAQSQGNAVPAYEHASLTITETALGVDLMLNANWAGGANRIDQLMFVYSGDAFDFVDGAGPTPTLSLQDSKKIDSGYFASSFVISASWAPNGVGAFDSSSSSTNWSMNGANVSLSDFIDSATTSPNKPSPAFGVISMPGANIEGAAGSNWVAEGYTPVQPVPEPQTYALMGLGLAMVAWVTRRQRRQAQRPAPQTA